MKTRELKDLRKESLENLTKKLAELKVKRDKTQVSLSSGKETNLAVVRVIKRDIAQISSIIHELSNEKKEVKEVTK